MTMIVLALCLAFLLTVLVSRDTPPETTTLDPITVQQGDILEP